MFDLGAKELLEASLHRARRPGTLRVPAPLLRYGETGLGELVKRITSFFRIEPCEACLRRAAVLDGVLVFKPRQHAPEIVFSSNCTTFKGSCTGFGGNQCVTAPVSLEPDALTITQCCSGRFQYPWVEVCPGKEPNVGCSFCLF